MSNDGEQEHCEGSSRTATSAKSRVAVVPPPESTFSRIEPGPRQPVFDFYKDSPSPLWGITVRLDVTALRNLCRKQDDGQPSFNFLQASLFLFAKTANQYAPMRYRIRTDGKTGAKYMICHEYVHPSITIMRRDGSDTYGYCFWKATDTYPEFTAYATAVLEDFHGQTSRGLDGNPRDDVMHGSVLPWLDFTSYEHAVGRLTMTSIPKYTFGKIVQDATTGRYSQALALHVHHGCMDGLHVGRFVELLQDNLNNAESLVAGDATSGT